MIEGQEGVSWDEWLGLARACEVSGIDGLFRSDHYVSFWRGSGGSLETWTTLAGLAERTERIRLGALVSPVGFRHPSELAKAAVTVDHISGGRVELGLGAGWNEHEHRSYGFPFPELGVRMEMLAEQLEIVHRQWTGDEFDFAGRHYRLEGCRAEPKPVQQPHPPLIVGGAAGRRSVELAARYADEYNTVGGTPDECGERRVRLDRACKRLGRDPGMLRLSLMLPAFVVGADRAELRRRDERLSNLIGRDVAASPARVAGTVDEVVERLRAYGEAGVECVYLQHLDHADLEPVRLVGAEVVPAVA